MKIKVSETTNTQLDWLVANIEEAVPVAEFLALEKLPQAERFWKYNYSTNWSQGGQIIEREKIRFDDLPDNGIRAFIRRPVGKNDILLMDCWDEGITPLIAAMRCYVASKLGNEVEVPDELGEQP